MIARFSGHHHLRGLAISVALAALGYLGFVVWAGWSEVLRAFSEVGIGGMAIALTLSLVNYGLRFARWQMYLQALDCNVPLNRSARIYFAGFALTTTPGKAGELLRGVFLRDHGLSYAQSAAAFVSERLSDLIAILLLAIAGLAAYPEGRLLAAGAAALVALVLVMLSWSGWRRVVANRVAGASGRVTWMIRAGLSVLDEAVRCHRPRVLLAANLLSLVAWAAEAFGAYLVMRWLGFDAGLLFAFAAYSLAMLAGALSFLPGGLGGTEAVMVAIVIWGGMAQSQAVAATVVVRLATLWFAVVLGVLALVTGRAWRLHSPDGEEAHV
jgi:uncharacterized protein (TIRG00374 family)